MTPLRIAAVSAFALTAAFATGAFASSLTITPAPAKVVEAEGSFTLSAATRIHVPKGDVEARGVAIQLADLIQRSRGFRPLVAEGPPSVGAIVLTREGPSGEAYTLDINAKGVTIAAAKRAGLFYGAMSLWQLATPDETKGPVALPAAAIEDAPRFAWRGLMVDSARHYQSLDTLKAVIDAMAAHKLNTFHWHLVDDQGWRLEIKKYPKLTQVAAWRRNRGAAVNYPKYGGFYTQDQARELVAYAAARNITVVPEIETPGHALAPIVAYPQLGTAPPDASKMGDWGVFPWLYNTDDATFAFLDDVLNEVMDIFPSTFIHVGGDEAIKDQWKASAKIQAKIKELGLKDEHELQSWFIQRVGKTLEKRGRRLIGWDEILEGGLAPNATVMSWRGIDGAIVAAKMGHDTVLSPAPTLYLNHRESASPDEPPGRGQVISLKDVYDFDPMPAGLRPEEQARVLGVQANLWTEHVRTEDRAWRMYFPRVTAVAEAGWTPQARRSWTSFADRLPAELDRQRSLSLAFNETPLKVRALAKPAGQRAQVVLTGAEAVGEIRYTTDGREPTATSTAYAGAFDVAVPTTLKAAAFRDGKRLTAPSTLRVDARSIRTRVSQELKACTDKLTLNLEDDAPFRGERAVYLVDIMNPCWIYEGADLTGVRQIEVAVGQLPFNFQIGADVKNIPLPAPQSPDGELEVRRGSCEAPVTVRLPLSPALRNDGLTVLRAPMSGEGAQDLCLSFTRRSVDPIWVVDRVTLLTEAAGGR